jgi:hypothetical protein
MSDIATRLRAEIAWEQEIGELLEEAATEIERLRLTDANRAAIDPVAFGRLNDEEQKAIAYYVGTGGPDAVDATLRGLLERLK